ncbi:discoidin domain-containing protein [Winogradskya consettensis]|uniref:discoidin domain-containing protein n=1 Tax=Winogradskya consettensis TaxID=113560 RepID=UPI001BB382BF|nr:discoidin domain-containing protein [Actinoplanes consettensis]
MSISRRGFLALPGIAGATLVTPDPPWPVQARDAVADIYRELLHVHTRWVEQQWDAAIGAYRAADFRFAAVLGNAVLLGVEGYDAELAGVDRETLRSRTLATIRRFAATNVLAGGTEWGRRLFWDSTFELYFVLAARILWDDLDDATRSNVTAIAEGQAAYAYGLGTADDPLSGDWTPHGTTGGRIGDTKLEEMGVYAQALAPGVAWTGDPAWRERFDLWAMNASGLPAADAANPALVDGRRVSDNTAGNLYDTFIVENHGSANPHYQAELWRTAGRAAIHFLVAGRPLPQVLTHQPNGEQLWRTLRLLATDAGEPVMPMVADRYHLYGRDILPLAFLAQVQGDRDAARAEADLAARMMPYLTYAPQYQLTKFSGEDKYEPEARAELAIAYLFHRHRGRPVAPLPAREFFRRAAGTRDFGADVGLTAQQAEDGFAAAVTKPGFVRFLWQPRHDHWLIDTRGPGFLPAGATATARSSTAYETIRDSFDATATVLAVNSGYAGFVTLPTGSVVYASTGVGPDEGSLTLFALSMPGVPGLTGTRTFTGAQGTVTLAPQSIGGTQEVSFPARSARFVRMLGRRPATQYGYSLWTFAVLDQAGTDLARQATPTASSQDPAHPAAHAVDGNELTRWAVAREERARADSWLAVDLGADQVVSGVRLSWEAAYAGAYVVQTSVDGDSWADAVAVPDTRTVEGGWIDIDGRAGIVNRDPARAIAVTATSVVAAPGPAAPTLLEGYAGDLSGLARIAARPAVTAPSGLRADDVDGFLSVFNLTAVAVTGAPIGLPSARRLYRGVQIAVGDGLDWFASLAAGSAVVEAPRFTVDGRSPAGTRFEVTDSHHVTVTAPPGERVGITVRAGHWSARVDLPRGRSRSLTVPGGPVTPAADLARGRMTFPTSPLPEGMGAPARAVDGDPATAWRPGPAGRMVVDLGTVRSLTRLRLAWSSGPRVPVVVQSSTDGTQYADLVRIPRPTRNDDLAVRTEARYVAVAVPRWRTGNAELAVLEVF